MAALRIGSRGSQLALWQANHIAALLRENGHHVELEIIRTTGDKITDVALAKVGTKGMFTKEIEEALAEGRVDLAVHSLKDLPTETPPGFGLAAITRREDPRDVLLSRSYDGLSHLPQGARVGTSSLRRQAQLRHHRPDIEALDLRGNVDTRLKKLDAREFDAIVLAVAGVNRLGVSSRITQVMDADIMLPAVGQGALGIETRANDTDTSCLVAALDHAETRACVTAERALLHELQGGCQVPLGAWAHLLADDIHLEAAVFSADGTEFIRRDSRGSATNPAALGKQLGKILLEAGADKILRLAGRTVGQP